MIRFNNDYSEGAHPAVLERLLATNMEQTPGYGTDDYCASAASLIRQACQAPHADVHFLTGGTQANLTVIAAALRPYQGVICAESGHIHVHETGALEACGHKALVLPSSDGKITQEQIAALCQEHFESPIAEHTVQPGMVYLSFPTELGTLYSLEELEAIAAVCRQYGLFLFIDGARLAYGLGSAACRVTLPDLARLCDAFYIGGTKAGALLGEAVVITTPALQRDFRYHIKQRGAMLAKGRLLGLQFEALFQNGLYLEIGRHAVALAMQLKEAFISKGYPLLVDSPTNQQFVILPDTLLDKLSKNFTFEYQQRIDASHCAVRFCTGWATSQNDLNALIAAL